MLLLFVLGGALAVLVLQFGMAAYNRRVVPRPAPDLGVPEPEWPSVSVLVPARNEERLIRECVSSLLALDYPKLEVVVLNDGSTDGTAEILNSLSDPRLRVVAGSELPTGWVGKNWACHQLSQQARGEWLLFTDADTVHAPQSLKALLGWALRRDRPFVSLFPFEQTETWGERLVIPFLFHIFLCYLPYPVFSRTPGQPSGANGQYLLFRRTLYDAIEGHAGAPGAIVEDVVFAQRVKAYGIPVEVVRGVELVSCRMYTSFREVWEGFSKNFYLANNASTARTLLFAAKVFWVFILPPLLLPLLVMAGYTAEAWLAGLCYAVSTATQAANARYSRLRMADAFLWPLSAVLASLISANSLFWYSSKRGTRWKGRSYDKAMLVQHLEKQ